MDLAKLIERAKGICLSPKAEWPKIAAETTDVKSLYVGYAALGAGLLAICMAQLVVAAQPATDVDRLLVRAERAMDLKEIERLQHEIAAKYGYVIEDHSLVLYVRQAKKK